MYVHSKGFGPEDVILEQDFCLQEGVCVTATCYERSIMNDVQISFWLNNSKEIATIDIAIDDIDCTTNTSNGAILEAMAKYIYSNEQAIIEMATKERSDSYADDRP